MADFESNDQRGDIFSKAVRAGKRTYFFDVRSTRSNEFYLTITESKKRFNENGEKPFYEKHKLFLYKEDFEKFIDGLNEAINHIRTQQPGTPERTQNREGHDRYTDLNFEDLGGPQNTND